MKTIICINQHDKSIIYSSNLILYKTRKPYEFSILEHFNYLHRHREWSDFVPLKCGPVLRFSWSCWRALCCSVFGMLRYLECRGWRLAECSLIGSSGARIGSHFEGPGLDLFLLVVFSQHLNIISSSQS
jgi:hypothetical protein